MFLNMRLAYGAHTGLSLPILALVYHLQLEEMEEALRKMRQWCKSGKSSYIFFFFLHLYFTAQCQYSDI